MREEYEERTIAAALDLLSLLAVVRLAPAQARDRLAAVADHGDTDRRAEIEGDAHLAQDEYGAALDCYRTIALDVWRVREKIGACLLWLRRHEEAIPVLDEAVAKYSPYGIYLLIEALSRTKYDAPAKDAAPRIAELTDLLLSHHDLDIPDAYNQAELNCTGWEPEAIAKRLAILADGIARFPNAISLRLRHADLSVTHRVGPAETIYQSILDISSSMTSAQRAERTWLLYRAARACDGRLQDAIKHLDILTEKAADDANGQRFLMIEKAMAILDHDPAAALDLADRAGADGPEVYSSGHVSWDLPLAALRVRIHAALRTGKPESIREALGRFVAMLERTPRLVSEMAALDAGVFLFSAGGHRFTESDPATIELQFDELMNVASAEQRTLLALVKVISALTHDGDAPDLTHIRGNASHLEAPLHKSLVQAIVAIENADHETAGRCVTLAAMHGNACSPPADLPTLDLAKILRSKRAAAAIVGGYIAALAEPGVPPDAKAAAAWEVFDTYMRSALINRKYYDRLLAAAEALHAAEGGGVRANFEVGLANHYLSHLDAAAASYREALKEEPVHYSALYNLAFILEHQKSQQGLNEIRTAAAQAAGERPDDDRWPKLIDWVDAALSRFEASEQAAKEAASEAALLERLKREAGERNRQRRVSYADLPDDVAIILLALDRTLGSQTFERHIFRSDCTSLAPARPGVFINKLWDAEVIADDPSHARKDAYFLKDGELWHYSDRVAYIVAPDTHCRVPADSMMILTGRRFENRSALRDLWLTYATADCLAYLYTMLGVHSMVLTEEHDAAISASIRSALQKDSVSDIWSVIWMIVKDAAALAQRQYYNSAKAAATLPGKFLRHIEGVAKGTKGFGQWRRHHDQPAGTIGQVLYDLFGIDEYTKGADVDALLAPKPLVAPQPVVLTNEMGTTIDIIIERANHTKRGPEMMRAFAEAILAGRTFEEAIAGLESEHPAMKESK